MVGNPLQSLEVKDGHFLCPRHGAPLLRCKWPSAVERGLEAYYCPSVADKVRCTFCASPTLGIIRDVLDQRGEITPRGLLEELDLWETERLADANVKRHAEGPDFSEWHGTKGEEKGVSERYSPVQETLTYQQRSHAFLAKAREQLEAEDFEQASEKAWGAAALMVKAVAQARGKAHYAHPFLAQLVDDLADEMGDDRLSRLFDAAESLHTNFYENRFRARGVRRRLRDVEEFVETMGRILNVHNS